jgi:Endosomal/lysosomal potassium channel TMEM175
MNKSRLEAFSDGVIAILITIMVLELRAPHSSDWGALRGVVPSILTYVLSFVLLGIYWNNHHYMLQATDRINGAPCGPICTCSSARRWFTGCASGMSLWRCGSAAHSGFTARRSSRSSPGDEQCSPAFRTAATRRGAAAADSRGQEREKPLVKLIRASTNLPPEPYVLGVSMRKWSTWFR